MPYSSVYFVVLLTSYRRVLCDTISHKDTLSVIHTRPIAIPSRYDAICNIMQYSQDIFVICLWYVMAKSYYCAPTVHLTTDQFTIYIVSMIHTYSFRIVHRHCILAVYYEDIDLRYVCHCTLSTIQICHHMSTPTSDLCRTKKHIIDVSHDTWYV